MALTALEETNINALLVSMFNSSAGDYFQEIEDIFNTNGNDLSLLAETLGTHEIFEAQFSGLSNEEKAESMLQRFGLTNDSVAGSAGSVAYDYFLQSIINGVSPSDILLSASTYLTSTTGKDPIFNDTTTLLENKACVAQEFSKAGVAYGDLAAQILTVVTLDQKSVGAGKAMVSIMPTGATVITEAMKNDLSSVLDNIQSILTTGTTDDINNLTSYLESVGTQLSTSTPASLAAILTAVNSVTTSAVTYPVIIENLETLATSTVTSTNFIEIIMQTIIQGQVTTPTPTPTPTPTDSTAPLLDSSTPADNATAIAVGSNIVLTFDENVQAGTGNISIRRSDNNNLFEAIDVTSGQVSITGGVVTINPASNLLAATQYYVQVDATAIQDTSANSYAGIADTTSLSFTIETPTIVTTLGDWNTADGNGDISVIVNGNITLGGTPVNIVNAQVLNGATLTASAAQISGRSVNGAGTAAITALETTAAADLSGIVATASTAAVGGNVTFTGNLGTVTTTVAGGSTLTTTAAIATGKTINGAGAVAITALESTAAADLSGITATTSTAAIGGNVTFTGNLGTVTTTVSGAATLTTTAATASGTTINGAGAVAITALESTAAADLSGITATTSTAAVTGNVTFTGDLGSVTTTVAGGSTLTTTAAIASGTTINGAGTVAITALQATAAANFSSITSTTVTGAVASNVTFTGDLGTVTVTIADGATLTAAATVANGKSFVTATTTGNISITDSAGAQTITGTAAADNISAGSGADTVNAGAGDDTVTMSVVAGDIDTLDGGGGTGDVLALTGVAAGAIIADLSSATQQFTDGVDALTQANFENLDATSVTGAKVDIVTIANTTSVGLGSVTGAIVSGAATTLAVDASALVDGATATLSGANMVPTVTGLSGTLVATAVTGTLNVTTADATDNAVAITTGSGNLTLTASAATDTVTVDTSAMTGAQTLTANAGASALNLTNITTTGAINASAVTGGVTAVAGAGAQTITTGSGDDFITGGAGQDIIDLGTGDDEVIFNTNFAAGNASADIITGFTVGAGSSDIYDVTFDVNNGTTTATGNLNVAPITVGDNGSATANDVIFLLAGANDQMATSTVANAVANAVTALTSGADFAAANVDTGDNMLLVLDDGADAFIFHYQADGTNAVTSAADLELIGVFQDVTDAGTIVTTDFV